MTVTDGRDVDDKDVGMALRCDAPEADREALFAVSHSFAESEDGAEFRANTAELLTQLRLLDEMEEISIKNIL